MANGEGCQRWLIWRGGWSAAHATPPPIYPSRHHIRKQEEGFDTSSVTNFFFVCFACLPQWQTQAAGEAGRRPRHRFHSLALNFVGCQFSRSLYWVESHFKICDKSQGRKWIFFFFFSIELFQRKMLWGCNCHDRTLQLGQSHQKNDLRLTAVEGIVISVYQGRKSIVGQKWAKCSCLILKILSSFSAVI